MMSLWSLILVAQPALNVFKRLLPHKKDKKNLKVNLQTDCPQALPWLVLPHGPNCKHLSFSSFSEGKVHKLILPKPVQGGWFYGSSNGWLLMVQEKGLNSKMFLVNPISGAKHQLPPLKTIPSFKKYVATKEWKRSGGSIFFHRIILSSADTSQCMVAAVFGSFKELGLCRPGDKSWRVFQVLDDQKDELVDIAFSSGMLHALINTGNNNGVIAAQTLDFGDQGMELKLVYNKLEKQFVKIENHDEYQVFLEGSYRSYLLESRTKDEVLLIHQMQDVFLSRGRDEDEDVEDDKNLTYLRTSGFRIYKIDLNNGKFLRVKSLRDQILFLGDQGSLSLPASDFKDLEGNCIYFARNGVYNLHYLECRKPYISREIGIFYLDGGRIERCFPSVDTSIRSKLSWFGPNYDRERKNNC